MEPFDQDRCDDPDYLFGLVGRDAEYAGEPYTILDVLPEGPHLVLQHRHHYAIQSDLQDRAYRRVPETLTLSLRDGEGRPSELLGLLYLDSPEGAG